MSIHSSMFGGVTLTDEDAAKFRNQITHGRPKKAAAETVRRGVKLSREFQKRGYVVLSAVPAKKKRGRR